MNQVAHVAGLDDGKKFMDYLGDSPESALIIARRGKEHEVHDYRVVQLNIPGVDTPKFFAITDEDYIRTHYKMMMDKIAVPSDRGYLKRDVVDSANTKKAFKAAVTSLILFSVRQIIAL